VFQKTKPMHFLFSHFSTVDLTSTEHCCNSHHLLLLLDPQPALTNTTRSKCWNSNWSHHWMREGRARLKQTTTINIFLHFVNSTVYPNILAVRRSSYGKQFFISEENEIYLFMHRLNCIFWNMVNFVGFSVIHVSQGSVATGVVKYLHSTV